MREHVGRVDDVLAPHVEEVEDGERRGHAGEAPEALAAHDLLRGAPARLAELLLHDHLRSGEDLRRDDEADPDQRLRARVRRARVLVQHGRASDEQEARDRDGHAKPIKGVELLSEEEDGEAGGEENDGPAHHLPDGGRDARVAHPDAPDPSPEEVAESGDSEDVKGRGRPDRAPPAA